MYCSDNEVFLVALNNFELESQRFAFPCDFLSLKFSSTTNLSSTSTVVWLDFATQLKLNGSHQPQMNIYGPPGNKI